MYFLAARSMAAPQIMDAAIERRRQLPHLQDGMVSCFSQPFTIAHGSSLFCSLKLPNADLPAWRWWRVITVIA